jgi:hypothetical protein
MIPSNESRARDKSGYKVLRPEEMIQRFYTKFPEKITEKIDSVYDQIKDVQTQLLGADFNSPTRYSSKYRNAYARFGDAVDEYRTLLNSFGNRSADDLKNANRYDFIYRGLSNQLSTIKKDLADVLNYLGEAEE